jgi:acetoacetyl-CoA synthetase
MSKPLWMPSQDRVDRANLSRFMRFVRGETGNADLNSYAPLYRFSVDQPAAFWTLLWDFVGIRGSGERVPVRANEDGPLAGVHWFPGVSLSAAQNLLRFDDERVALRWIRPGREDVSLTYAELQRRVAALAAALRARGVGVGDQVAAMLPASPDALVAMLATASVGAVWFACPPALDRAPLSGLLEALQPELLFAQDAGDFDGLPVGDAPRILLGDDAIGEEALAAVLAAHEGAPADHAMVPFEHPLYLTAFRTPGGAHELLVHGAGVTLMQHLKELVLHADLKREDRVYFQAGSDTLAWYWLASALASGATLVLADEAFAPEGSGLWDLVDEAGLTVLGLRADWLDAAAASAIVPRETHRLLTLKTLLAGGVSRAETAEFVFRDIKERLFYAPVAAGADTLACLAIGAPLLPVTAGEIPCRALGMRVEVLDADGLPVVGVEGDLACSAPFPSMPLGFWNDVDGARFAAACFARHPGAWSRGERAVLTPQDALVLR